MAHIKVTQIFSLFSFEIFLSSQGRKHLAQLKRLQDKGLRERTGGMLGLSDLLRPNKEIYDEKYWDRYCSLIGQSYLILFYDWSVLSNTVL